MLDLGVPVEEVAEEFPSLVGETLVAESHGFIVSREHLALEVGAVTPGCGLEGHQANTIWEIPRRDGRTANECSHGNS